MATFSIPRKIVINLAWGVLSLRPRSFRRDALTCIQGIDSSLRLLGEKNIPQEGPCLLTANHYSAAGFQAWWIALAISAVLPMEVHWVMTAAWTFDNRFYASPFIPLTRWLFRRTARVYGFTAMPPMPPDPGEITARAVAVRQTLEYAQRTAAAQAVIGLSPEGRDFGGGKLGLPPPGAGRFIAQLSLWCPLIYPVGVYLQSDSLCLHFGSPYSLPQLVNESRDQVDAHVSRVVMQAIASLLPFELRGDYGNETRFTF